MFTYNCDLSQNSTSRSSLDSRSKKIVFRQIFPGLFSGTYSRIYSFAAQPVRRVQLSYWQFPIEMLPIANSTESDFPARQRSAVKANERICGSCTMLRHISCASFALRSCPPYLVRILFSLGRIKFQDFAIYK